MHHVCCVIGEDAEATMTSERSTRHLLKNRIF